MAVAISPNQTVDVVLDEDEGKPKKEQTVFKFRVLRRLDRRNLMKLLRSVEGKEKHPIEALEKIENSVYDWLGRFLRGWEHFKDAEGNDMPFEMVEKKDVPHVSDETLDAISFKMGIALLGALLQSSMIDGDDRKN